MAEKNRRKNKQRLELTWIGKERRPRLEPRILLEDKKKSYHAAHRVTGADCFDNMLIHGDNLLALKALEADYAGKVKCIFIDPPYNTGSAFQHYDDGLEHSIWLTMMRDRLDILHRLLKEDGSLWIILDDNEAHYCKVLCDEMFGRQNFVANVVWQKKFSPSNDAKWLSDNHDHILIYGKDKNIWRPFLLSRTEEMDKRYKNPDNDTRGVWQSGDLSVKSYNAMTDYPITTPSGKIITPPASTCWRFSKERLKEMIADNRIWFGPKGDGVPRIKRFLSEVKQGRTSLTIWLHQEVGHNQDAKKEIKTFNDKEVFDTPKPERLMEQVLALATQPGDLVLDSFAGSGTTGAVAHKMNRRWIMVELGEHCDTHILPRLRKVIDGQDEGGITKSADWKGGGGFRYYTIAPSLLKKDKWGRYVVNKAFNPEMLSQALCKQAGFTYDPSPDIWWQHGHSSERDFIYATTQTFTHAQLAKLSEEIGDDRSLFIYCGGFKANLRQFVNLTVRKIPPAILKNCEWDRDDYSLETQNLSYASGTQTKMAFSDDK